MHKILANTQFLGKDVVYLTECHSTNDVALEFVRSGKATHGMVFWTLKQTKGKGQRGSSWYSEPDKNLTFSIVLKHKSLNVSSLFLLNVAVSLAVHKVLATFSDMIFIKWPNDFVHVNKGKIGGMLIENSISGNHVQYSVVGLGINVNQVQFPFPSTGSLRHLVGFDISLGYLLEEALASIEVYYNQLIRGELDTFIPSYLDRLYRFQKWAAYDDGAPFEGKIVDVEQDGRLVIQKQNGMTHRYSLKSIKFL